MFDEADVDANQHIDFQEFCRGGGTHILPFSDIRYVTIEREIRYGSPIYTFLRAARAGERYRRFRERSRGTFPIHTPASGGEE